MPDTPAWRRQRLPTLVLTGSEVKPLVSMKDILEVAEDAFREKSLGRVQMPPKTYLYYPAYGGDLRSMPSALENPEISAVKIVNFHPGNRKMNLPSVMATILLVDPKTGQPLSIMDGTWLTALRTGAATATATKYLAREDSTSLGIVGAGTQAVTQLEGILSVASVRRVRVYDLHHEAALIFVERAAAEHPNVVFEPVRSVEEAVTGVDILVTVTPAREPVVSDRWVQEGLHINAIGADAPGKEELDPAILRRAKIVVDDRIQTSHGGEINVPLKNGQLRPEDIYAELGDIVARKVPGRESEKEVTVFDSTGIAILDAVSAKLVYDRALQKGVGRVMNLVS